MALIKCEECKKEISDTSKVCIHCGCPIEKINICPECGSKIKNNDKICKKCGYNLKSKKIELQDKKNIFIIGGILIVLFLIVLIILLNGTLNKDINQNTPNKKKINFEEIVNNTNWTCDYSEKCRIASDGSYLKLDTKPHNNENYDDPSTTYLIEEVNEALGFSSALFQKMSTTSGIDGKQTEENEYVKVSWSYVSSKGLEVIYELK